MRDQFISLADTKKELGLVFNVQMILFGICERKNNAEEEEDYTFCAKFQLFYTKKIGNKG